MLTQLQTSRVVNSRSVHVTLSTGKPYWLRSPCIAIPIATKGLPSSVEYQHQKFNVKWEAGAAWEILKDVQPAPVQEGGGIWIILYVKK